MNSAISDLPTGLPDLLEEQRKHLDLISHLISHSDLLVVIYGPKGSGKTLLSRSFCTDSDNSICLTSEQVSGLEDVLDVLAQLWELPSLDGNLEQDRSMLLEESKSQRRKDSPVKIIIDDAQNLEPRLLKSLAELAFDMSDSVAMALFGEVGFADGLKESLDDEAPLYFYKLSPLALASVKALIRQAGINLSDDEFQTLYQLHDNWPGTMLEAARHAVEPESEEAQTSTEQNSTDTKQTAAPSPKEDTRASFGTKHIFALAGLATLLVMMLIYTQNYEQSQQTISLDLSDANSSPQQEQNQSKAEKPTDYNYSQEKQPSVSNEPKQELNEPEPPESFNNNAEPENKPLVKKEESKITKEPVVNKEQKQNTAKVEKAPKKEITQNAKPKPKAASSKKKAPDGKAKFVVQLFGSYDLAAAKNLKKSLKVNQPVNVYATTRNQRNWYITVLGPFANKAEASNSIKALPAKIKSQSPWIRTTKNLNLQP